MRAGEYLFIMRLRLQWKVAKATFITPLSIWFQDYKFQSQFSLSHTHTFSQVLRAILEAQWRTNTTRCRGNVEHYSEINQTIGQ